jgi:hypothetical protein
VLLAGAHKNERAVSRAQYKNFSRFPSGNPGGALRTRGAVEMGGIRDAAVRPISAVNEHRR